MADTSRMNIGSGDRKTSQPATGPRSSRP
jgi:hypothetical protein